MIVKNLKEVAVLDEHEIAPGVPFAKNIWRIELGHAEHVSFNFSSVLDSKNSRSCDYPDLIEFIKILTNYSFPESPTNQIRSWHSTVNMAAAIRRFAQDFLFENFFVTKSTISLIDPIQIRKFLDRSAQLYEHSPKHEWIIANVPRLLHLWVFASELDSMPEWCRANFVLSDVISKDVEAAQKAIWERYEEGDRGWQPLTAHQIKMSYDAAHDYIYEFSDAIFEVSQLIITRPRFEGEVNNLMPVRSDGKTKELFEQLKVFKAPFFPNTKNRIFEFVPNTKSVKSKGYTSGYQDRTTIDISDVRPHVINLKRACIFVIGLLTGMRRAEIAYLKIGALSVRDGADYLRITRFKTSSDPKTGTADNIPVPPIVVKAVQVLEKLFAHQRKEVESDFLLLSDVITRKKFEKIKISTIGKDVHAFILESSGEPGHTHQLRKSIAWLLISKGEENLDLIRQLFGHKSYGMTLRYVMRNDLLSGSVIELLEENYTQDLQEALSKIVAGEALGELADALRKRSTQLYPGQILVSEIEAFVHANLEAGVPLFISRIPIGGFCISQSDLSEKKPPCIADTDDGKPNPEFCDYINCPHVLHTSESRENVGRQIAYYEKKRSYLPEDGDDRIEHYYESKIQENIALLDRLKKDKARVIARETANAD